MIRCKIRRISAAALIFIVFRRKLSEKLIFSHCILKCRVIVSFFTTIFRVFILRMYDNFRKKIVYAKKSDI